MTGARDTSSIMRQVHSRDTAPELKLRKALRHARIAYRLRNDWLPGKPDILIPRARLAIFIDGEYWHGGQWIKRGLSCLEDQFRKSSNPHYWLKKIRNNMRRDVEATAALLEGGWKVLRLWESSVNEDVSGCMSLVMDALESNQSNGSSNWVIPFKTVAEFFAGIGLVRLGLESGNWRVIYANDIDRNKRQMYVDHFGDESQKFDLRDIRDIKAAAIPDVTLATASFPCNDTSLAGGRKGFEGDKSSTFWEFVRLLREMDSRRPPIVLIENVAGFLTSNGGKDFEAALRAISELGYLVDSFQIDASSFTPQSRKRLFVIGTLERLISKEDWWTNVPVVEGVLRPRKLAGFINGHDAIKWLSRPLPNPGRSGVKLKDIIESIDDDDPVWWSKSRSEYLLGQMDDFHRSKSRAIIEGADYEYATVFRRVRKGVTRAELRNDGMAGCLRTPRGGSARQILFRGGRGNFRVRLLTSRECARLMGAGDYTINVSESQALHGFGDAVVAPVLEWIATYYLNPVVNLLLRGRVIAPRDVVDA